MTEERPSPCAIRPTFFQQHHWSSTMKLPCPATLILILFFAAPSMSFGQDEAVKKVTVGDNVSLHYVERGKGEPIIFVHGLGGDYSVWLRQLDAFAASDFLAISYSRRYNHPNKNTLRPNHSAIIEAGDLASLIRKLNLKKAHIVGHSYGAHTALILALQHPKLVHTVTLAEPPIGSWLNDLPDAQSDAGKAHLQKLLTHGVHPAKRAIEAGNQEVAIRTMLDCIAAKPVYDGLPKFVKNRMMRNINELKALVSSPEIYPPVDRDQVRRLAVPTLILSGEKTLAMAKFTDAELERLIPKQWQTRVVLPGASHIMWVEQPVQSREAVLQFIRNSR